MRNNKGRFLKGGNLGTDNSNYIHGMSGTRFHRIYRNIYNRCTNRNVEAYPEYGGRGINCVWNSFETFRDDMHESYLLHVKEFGEKNTTIDRIDNNKGYFRENCRWATIKVQMRNKRSNVLYSFQGKELTLSEISESIGIPWKTLWKRINGSGWKPDRAFVTPLRQWPGAVKL